MEHQLPRMDHPGSQENTRIPLPEQQQQQQQPQQVMHHNLHPQPHQHPHQHPHASQLGHMPPGMAPGHSNMVYSYEHLPVPPPGAYPAYGMQQYGYIHPGIPMPGPPMGHFMPVPGPAPIMHPMQRMSQGSEIEMSQPVYQPPAPAPALASAASPPLPPSSSPPTAATAAAPTESTQIEQAPTPTPTADTEAPVTSPSSRRRQSPATKQRKKKEDGSIDLKKLLNGRNIESYEKEELEKLAKLDLPVSRVRKVLRVDPDSVVYSKDATFAIAAATEHFLSYIGTKSVELSRLDRRSGIQYKDVANAVEKYDALGFLEDLIPKTVPVSTARKMKPKGSIESSDTNETNDTVAEGPEKTQPNAEAE
ncbi:hypothetical protein CANCADRAFT_45006 [Tortispora caseinolytica NRRL Y-17796]|uniref:Transcription factor CBF/NF-Y/archaeal histone domain-containing protein n=1 Tax=Tortispora caseinolytica NRRL Y-17796 TaxID=767744 RepID=A0A1E4TI44_9ASCO|nr:hypothetical protein CANCADRAFT_45006 [Tortispora caseinolytica NRRL Y-17796]